MEDLSSLWSYQEGIDDLKRRLLCTTIELESFKMEAKDEIRKSEEILTNLFDLLKVVQKERDEARDQLQKLLNYKVMPNAFPQTQPEIPILLPANIVNSSIAESNSLSVSETYNNHQSYSSSPVDSFFDSVNSPELSNINVVDSSNKICFANKTNDASALFKNIAKGKVLPQKGKLLQTVMEAGPLLQTLLVAGPLPRWRNPPKMKPFNIPPPFSVKAGCETTTSNCYMSPKPLISSLGHTEMSSPGFPQTCSSSLLNFVGSPPNSSLNSTTRLLGSSYVNSSINSQIPLDKRRRLQ